MIGASSSNYHENIDMQVCNCWNIGLGWVCKWTLQNPGNISPKQSSKIKVMGLMKAVFRGKFIALNVCIRKEENSEINKQSFHIRKLNPK